MAEKEATVFIVDLGRSMNEQRHGREITDLDWALQYVWDRMTSTIALDRKTTFQAAVGLKTDGTSNSLEQDPSYSNISVFQELSQILLPDLHALRDKLVPSSTDDGDAISAIVLAIQMIEQKCKKLKYIRRIILVTNGRGELDGDQIEPISSKIKQEGIELIVLGADFDDEDYPFKEEDKDPQKACNESILKALVEACGGVFGTLAQAIEELSIPRLKSVKPVPSYRRDLSLGVGEGYSGLSIEVERYPRVMIRAAPSASSYVVRADGTNGTDGEQLPDAGELDGDDDVHEFSALRTDRMYEIKDKDAEGGKREVPQSELQKGYAYGRTAVWIDEPDKHHLDLETKQSLELLGFIPRDNFERFMCMSTTNVIVGPKGNSKASMALSSVIHALRELESFAIGRYVSKDDKGPLLLLLAPLIEPDFECLVDVQLPFAEDVRQYRFPRLDKIVTVDGDEVQEHRFLPDKDLQAAMDDYVDSMDLDQLDDDEGSGFDFIHDVYSPIVHRVDQVVRHRAVHGEDEIPPIPDVLLRYSKPLAALIGKSRDELDRLRETANLQKVSPKVRGRKEEDRRAITNLDPTSLRQARSAKEAARCMQTGSDRSTPEPLVPSEPAVHRVDPENAISSFKMMLAHPQAGHEDTINEAAAQLGTVIEKQLRKRFGATVVDQVLEKMGVFRTEMEGLDAAEPWNAWLRGLKKKLFDGDLGGDGHEIMWQIRVHGLGLLHAGVLENSDVSEAEAREFWRWP